MNKLKGNLVSDLMICHVDILIFPVAPRILKKSGANPVATMAPAEGDWSTIQRVRNKKFKKKVHSGKVT